MAEELTTNQTHPPGRGSALTPGERAEIQQLALVDGLSQSEIARRTRRDRGTIRAVLVADDTRQLAQDLATEARHEVLLTLRRNSARVARDWVEASSVAKTKGDHRPARDLLLHARAIEPIESRGDTGARVTLIIGQPGHPVPYGDLVAFADVPERPEDED